MQRLYEQDSEFLGEIAKRTRRRLGKWWAPDLGPSGKGFGLYVINNRKAGKVLLTTLTVLRAVRVQSGCMKWGRGRDAEAQARDGVGLAWEVGNSEDAKKGLRDAGDNSSLA